MTEKIGCRRRALAIAVALISLPSVARASAPGEIVAIQGTGEYRDNTTAPWGAAKVAQPLVGNSFVRTGSGSAMSLVLADRSQIRLGQNSMFQVKAVAPTGSGPTLMELQKGKAWSQAKGGGAITPAKSGPAVVMTTPGATAVINGTDWLVEVAEDGRTTVTVLTGEVALKNEHGEVTLSASEQGVAMPGRAPEKQRVVDMADRVQWIASYETDWSIYPELAAQPTLRSAVEGGDIVAISAAGTPLAALLAAEIALRSGEPKAAAARLAPLAGNDARAARLHAIALLQAGELAAARAAVVDWQRRNAQAAEAKWLLGEIERLDGRAEAARAAYRQAAADAAWRGRAMLGLGKVDAEREDVPPARAALAEALALGVPAEAEVALLETFAGHLDEARAHLAQRLLATPGDVVALTALGLLEIKAGRPEAALDALARAQAAAPRQARAAAYAGVAYYHLGRTDAALTSLRRAADLDPRDPVPHLFLAQIARDRLDPELAMAESRAAEARMPNLKSLNQLANDQRGGADVGAAVAFAGMEEWAASRAQQAYYPYWGGSHLFLADRYTGAFLKNAELMQGFLVDPLAFGASPKHSALLQRPDHQLSLGARYVHTDASHALEPYVVANGLFTSPRPIAYFVEGLYTDFRAGSMPFDAHSNNLTVGLGAQATSELLLFAYLSRFDVNGRKLPLPAGIMGDRVDGRAERADVGFSFRLGPEALLQAKIGTSEDRRDADERSSFARLTRIAKVDSDDVQFRFGARLQPDLELAAGAEAARQEGHEHLRFGIFARNEPSRAESSLAWLSLRWGETRGLLLQTDLFAQQQDQKRDDGASGERYRFDKSQALPRLGLSVPLGNNARLRSAWQYWRKPMSPGTLAPVATAGLPLADETVLPGGEQKRLRLQGEWESSGGRAFAMTFAETQHIENIAFNAFDAAENQYQNLARLDRLRQFDNAARFGSVETLEDRPVFTRGRIDQAGIVGNAMLGGNWSGQAGYVWARARNTSDWFDGNRLPWIPRQRAMFGVTWAHGSQWRLQMQTTYRESRFADEANTNRLSAGWDGALKLTWLSPKRDWQLEGFAAQLGKKDADTLLGINFVWRP